MSEIQTIQDKVQVLRGDNLRRTVEDIEHDPAQNENLADSVYAALGILVRQYLVVLLVVFLTLGAGVIYLLIATPIYTAQTNLYIDLHRNPIDTQPGIFSNDPIEIESQIQIIKSKAVASSVIKKLQLGGSKNESIEEQIAAFQNNLVIDPVANSRVVTIKYSSPSPDQAAQVANAVANAYITDQLEAKYQANRVATNWLQERQQQLREQADAAQRAVDNFKKQNNIVTTNGTPLDNVQVADLTNRLNAAKAQTTDLLTRLNRLQMLVQAGPSESNLDGAISEINSPIATNLRQQYFELARRESEWSTRYGKDHLAVVNLRNRMGEIRSSLFDELRQATATAKNDYEIAKQREQEIERQLADSVAQSRSTSQVQVTLSGLESAANAYRRLYDAFLQQYMGQTQQATFPITEARIISSASPPLEKSKPKTTLVLALSLLGGLVLGTGFGVLRDLMDRVFRTPKQLEMELQVPCVAVVPMVKSEPRELTAGTKSQIAANRHPAIYRNGQVFETVVNSPLSAFAEAIRSIKLTIDLHMDARPCKVIGFTSTLPNEGKSTIAASLAHLIAQVGGRVLLVDCDLRNPTLSRMLGGGATAGIFDVVTKKSSIADAIVKDAKSSLAFLPAGKRIPLFLTSEILGGNSISQVFEELHPKYNYILVDLPPLSPIIDARASAHLVDAYLLTVEWGRTKIDTVEHCLRSAPQVYENLIGAVLNKTDMDTIGQYDLSGRYDRNDHYSRYGYTA